MKRHPNPSWRRPGGRNVPVAVLLAPLLAATAHGAANPGPAGDPPASSGLDSLAARMSRNWLTRSLSQYVFQPAPRSLPEEGAIVPSESLFAPYRGLVVRRVSIESMDVFAAEDPEFGDAVQTKLDQLGNALHVRTRQSVVRRYLLVGPGDRLSPSALADTERLLRATPFIHEARILVAPVAGSPDSVDLEVVVRDSWTLALDVKLRSVSRYNLRLTDRNFAGLGHSFENEIPIDTEKDPAIGYAGTYTADNIAGTFVRGAFGFRDTYAERATFLDLSRGREAPQIRTLGALAASATRLKAEKAGERDLSARDGRPWLGRAFPAGWAPFGSPARAALVVAAGAEIHDQRERPDSVTADVNRLFHDRTRLLASVSFTESHYHEGHLLRSYGRTEDIQGGILAVATGGVELGEFEDRGYAAVELRLAEHGGWGYVGWRSGAGAFFGARRMEDGVAELGLDWLSPLWARNRYGFRQFATLGYTYGFERRESQPLFLVDELGGETADPGTAGESARLAGRLESVLFTPWTGYGFRVAVFGVAAAGTVGGDAGSFVGGRYFTTLGFGFRIHNRRLIFDPLELRFSFSTAHDDGRYRRLEFGSLPASRFLSLDPSAPAVLPYR